MTKKISTDEKVIAEAFEFCALFLKYCTELKTNPQAALAVMLFETGSSINSKFQPAGPNSAFGILQFVKEFAGTKRLLEMLGDKEATYLNVSQRSVLQWEKYRKAGRIEQLKAWYFYQKYHKFEGQAHQQILKTFAVKDPYLEQYIRTLNPNGNPTKIDGNQESAQSITQGSGNAGKNFANLKILAGKMLSGEEPFPGEEPSLIGRIGSASAMQAYHARVGYVKNPFNAANLKEALSGAGQAPTEGTEKGTTAEKAKPSLSEKLPVELSIAIPEYPRFVGLKPGDVIILPETSQLRDWLIVSVERTFNAGLNLLQISGRRPLDPKPFVQSELLARKISNSMNYYYLQ